MSNWTFITDKVILAKHSNGLVLELDKRAGEVFNIEHIPKGLSPKSLRVLSSEAEKEYQQLNIKGAPHNPAEGIPKIKKPTLSLRKRKAQDNG